MNMEALKLKLSVLPTEPGCYLMKDRHGIVVYVGEAESRRNRVKSGLSGAQRERTMRLVAEIIDFEFMGTNSEGESLLLEVRLRKKDYPRYNMRLKDDKSYPCIKVTKEEHPRRIVT